MTGKIRGESCYLGERADGSRSHEVATRSQESNSSDLRLAKDQVACKKQDSLIVQLFLNGDSIQSRSGKGLYNAVSA